jgi:hypothetical protein
MILYQLHEAGYIDVKRSIAKFEETLNTPLA